jgi:hypothetical protein
MKKQTFFRTLALTTLFGLCFAFACTKPEPEEEPKPETRAVWLEEIGPVSGNPNLCAYAVYTDNNQPEGSVEMIGVTILNCGAIPNSIAPDSDLGKDILRLAPKADLKKAVFKAPSDATRELAKRCTARFNVNGYTVTVEYFGTDCASLQNAWQNNDYFALPGGNLVSTNGHWHWAGCSGFQGGNGIVVQFELFK